MNASAPVAVPPYPSVLARRLEAEIVETIRDRNIAFSFSFTKIEALLGSRGHYQSALGFVADKARMKRHRAVIDFLFVELCPEHALEHADFLQNGGQLHERLSIEEMRRAEHVLFCAMLIAITVFDANQGVEESPVAWNVVVATARELAAASFDRVPFAPSH